MDSTVTEILLNLALAVISAGVAFLTWWLKKKLSISERETLVNYVDTAVRAAELIGASLGWTGPDKKEYVINMISEKFNIPADQLELLIEAAVAKLKTAGEELVKVVDSNASARIVPNYDAMMYTQKVEEQCKCSEQ